MRTQYLFLMMLLGALLVVSGCPEEGADDDDSSDDDGDDDAAGDDDAGDDDVADDDAADDDAGDDDAGDDDAASTGDIHVVFECSFDGSMMEGATVTLDGGSECTTDANGVCDYTGVEPGDHEVAGESDHNPGTPVTETATVVADQVTNVTLRCGCI